MHTEGTALRTTRWQRGAEAGRLLKRSLNANDDEINDRSKVQKADGTIKTTGGRLKPGCDTARKHTERSVEDVTPADFPEVRHRLG